MIPSIANIRKAIYCLNKRIDLLEGGDYYDTMVELSNKISALESLLDDNALNPTKAIDKFNEIVAFLDSIDNTETLLELLRDVIQLSYQQNYVTVPTYASLPVTGSADTIYRVSNYNGSTNQIDTTSYSEYVWDNSDYTLLCVKSLMSEVFDISAYHATGGTLATYADLSAALDSNNGGGVPQSLQKGGMSVKYVRTSDNKYVQYFLTKDEWSLSEADWQKMNLEEEVSQLGQELFNIKNCTLNKAYQYAALIDAEGYCASDLLQINVQNGDSVEWLINALKTDSPIVSIVWFDENGRRIETWDSSSNYNVGGVYTRDYNYDTPAKFAYVSGKYIADNPPYFKVNGNLVWLAAAEDGILEKLNKDIYAEKLHKISISEWNIGKCNEGLSPQGIPDEDMDEKVPQFKKLLTTICSDIFFVNECPLYLNQGNSGATQQNFYDAVLKQFYPFYSEYDQDTEMRIFSKFPISAVNKYSVLLPSSYSRSYIVGEIEINKKRIGICVLHGPVAGGATNAPADRIAYFEDIVGRFSSYDYVIIAGDTNIGNDAESESLIAEQIAVFIDAGYSLSNRGYWGVISTYNPLVSWQALDNIIVKGFNIDNFIVEDEKIVSDHFPIQSKISSLI